MESWFRVQGQQRIFSDIQKFGWDNIEHKILLQCLTESEAKNEEAKLILAYDSENPEKGYNRTSIKRELLKLEEDSKSIEKNNEALEERKIREQKERKILCDNAFKNGLEWFGLFTEDEISLLNNEPKLKEFDVEHLFLINEQFKNKLLFQKDILYPDGGIGLPPFEIHTIGEEMFVGELYREYLIELFEFYSHFFERG